MEFAPDIYPFVYSAYSATSSLYWEFLLSALLGSILCLLFSRLVESWLHDGCQSSSSVFASSSGLWFGLLLGLALGELSVSL